MLIELPEDIFTALSEHLSVQDCCRLAQTCTYVHSCIDIHKRTLESLQQRHFRPKLTLAQAQFSYRYYLQNLTKINVDKQMNVHFWHVRDGLLYKCICMDRQLIPLEFKVVRVAGVGDGRCLLLTETGELVAYMDGDIVPYPPSRVPLIDFQIICQRVMEIRCLDVNGVLCSYDKGYDPLDIPGPVVQFTFDGRKMVVLTVDNKIGFLTSHTLTEIYDTHLSIRNFSLSPGITVAYDWDNRVYTWEQETFVHRDGRLPALEWYAYYGSTVHLAPDRKLTCRLEWGDCMVEDVVGSVFLHGDLHYETTDGKVGMICPFTGTHNLCA